MTKAAMPVVSGSCVLERFESRHPMITDRLADCRNRAT